MDRQEMQTIIVFYSIGGKEMAKVDANNYHYTTNIYYQNILPILPTSKKMYLKTSSKKIIIINHYSISTYYLVTDVDLNLRISHLVVRNSPTSRRIKFNGRMSSGNIYIQNHTLSIAISAQHIFFIYIGINV